MTEEGVKKTKTESSTGRLRKTVVPYIVKDSATVVPYCGENHNYNCIPHGAMIYNSIFASLLICSLHALLLHLFIYFLVIIICSLISSRPLQIS